VAPIQVTLDNATVPEFPIALVNQESEQYYAKVLKQKAVISSLWKSISELRGVACHMRSHSITCHPTQANSPRLNPSQWRLVLDLPTPEGWKAELT